MKTLLRRWATSVGAGPGAELAASVRARYLTYLDGRALVDLFQAVKRIERLAVPGRIIEAGTALGGSAVMLASAKSKDRALDLYDTFGMIPPPGDKDGEETHRRYRDIADGRSAGIGGQQYYGYRGDLRQHVLATLEEFGVAAEHNSIRLIAGLYEDVLDPEDPVALAHIDCDWYESVRCCLDRIWPRLSLGGALVIDDYYTWSGCQSAVDEFVAAQPGVERVDDHARPHLIKTGE